MTQTGGNPPRFKVFGRDLKYLHWSYKRYMEKEMRELADFGGTPIEFDFESNSGRTRGKKTVAPKA